MSHQLLGVGESLPQHGHGQCGFRIPIGHLWRGVGGTGDSHGDWDGDKGWQGDGRTQDGTGMGTGMRMGMTALGKGQSSTRD